MDWFAEPDNRQKRHPEKISIKDACDIVYRQQELSRQLEELQEQKRIISQQEKAKEQEERVQARKDYLVKKYGDTFSFEEMEEFEQTFLLLVEREREKEIKQLKRMENEENQLRRDLFR